MLPSQAVVGSRGPAPKYYVLKQDLIRRIEGRQYREYEPILSERELGERYGVSRITVRRAIEELVKDGYLYKVQGRGTYVKATEYSQDLLSITSCTQDVRNLGMTPRRAVLSAEVIPVDDMRMSELELTKGDHVFRLERIYYADDTPINHTVAYLPYETFPAINLHDFSSSSLYEVLESEYQTKIIRAVRTIEAVLARGKIAEWLEVKPGVPILLFNCVTYGEVRGQRMPIETFECHYRSDKFKFYINQVAQ